MLVLVPAMQLSVTKMETSSAVVQVNETAGSQKQRAAAVSFKVMVLRKVVKPEKALSVSTLPPALEQFFRAFKMLIKQLVTKPSKKLFVKQLSPKPKKAYS